MTGLIGVMKLIRGAHDNQSISSRQKHLRQKILPTKLRHLFQKTANRSFEKKDFVTPAKAGVQTGSPNHNWFKLAAPRAFFPIWVWSLVQEDLNVGCRLVLDLFSDPPHFT